MCNCEQTLAFKLCCNCQENQPVHSATVSQDPMQAIYSKFASTLEQELKNQHQQHTGQVDQLHQQLFDNKNTILRLELRNKKDLAAFEELRIEYNALLLRLKNQDSRTTREVEVVQKVKEVPVYVDNDDLKGQVKYWKNKYEQVNPKWLKSKMEKQALQQQTQNIKNQISKLNKTIRKLENQVQQLKSALQDKDRSIDKANQHIQFLKNNKQVVVQTKHLFPEFRVPEKVRTETKVETVVVQKPVQKIVFVDVQKKIKQFVQPERAVVNRLISCQPNKNCKCEEDDRQLYAYKTQIGNLQSCVEQLQGNVNSYKVQREKLVDIIGNKNTELNYLESKVKLLGGNNVPVRMGGAQSVVNVQVNRVNSLQNGTSKGFVRADVKK